MRNVILGVLLGTGMMMGVAGWQGPVRHVYALPASSRDVAPGDDVIALLKDDGEKGRQLLLIDSRMRVLAVYQVDRQSGEVVLKSVRNFTWDLQMVEFNGTNPLPQEIRSMMESR